MNVNTLFYQILMVILGTHMMAFAWPLRGQFGHEWGAAIPGAVAGAVAALLVGRKIFRQAFAQAVLFGIFGFVVGSENIPYGALIDHILTEPTLRAAFPGLCTVLFIGASWGAVGATYLGYGLSEKPLSVWDYLVILMAGVLAVLVIFVFSANAAVAASLVMLIFLLQSYNFLFKKSRTVWIFGLAGGLGFGLGFFGAAVILYLGNKGLLPGPPEWWDLRDQIWGAAGGLALILATFKISEKNLKPVLLAKPWFQKAGFILFVPAVCGLNTWNVYEKWFSSVPPAPEPVLAGALVAAGAILLIAWLVYYMMNAAFSGPGFNSLLLASFLFFSFYLRFFAIAKSVVYSGWGAWEPAFTLFLFESVLFLLVLPFILLGPENP